MYNNTPFQNNSNESHHQQLQPGFANDNYSQFNPTSTNNLLKHEHSVQDDDYSQFMPSGPSNFNQPLYSEYYTNKSSKFSGIPYNNIDANLSLHPAQQDVPVHNNGYSRQSKQLGAPFDAFAPIEMGESHRDQNVYIQETHGFGNPTSTNNPLKHEHSVQDDDYSQFMPSGPSNFNQPLYSEYYTNKSSKFSGIPYNNIDANLSLHPAQQDVPVHNNGYSRQSKQLGAPFDAFAPIEMGESHRDPNVYIQETHGFGNLSVVGSRPPVPPKPIKFKPIHELAVQSSYSIPERKVFNTTDSSQMLGPKIWKPVKK
jgi:hypothetical protein